MIPSEIMESVEKYVYQRQNIRINKQMQITDLKRRIKLTMITFKKLKLGETGNEEGRKICARKPTQYGDIKKVLQRFLLLFTSLINKIHYRNFSLILTTLKTKFNFKLNFVSQITHLYSQFKCSSMKGNIQKSTNKKADKTYRQKALKMT